jgi:hypothetical protein
LERTERRTRSNRSRVRERGGVEIGEQRSGSVTAHARTFVAVAGAARDCELDGLERGEVREEAVALR